MHQVPMVPITRNLIAENNTNLLPFSSWDQKSEMSLTWLKSRCWQRCIPFWDPFPCLFQVLAFFVPSHFPLPKAAIVSCCCYCWRLVDSKSHHPASLWHSSALPSKCERQMWVQMWILKCKDPCVYTEASRVAQW